MADQSLEQFSRKFIHDIRTPISVLQMLSDLFASGQVSTDDLNIMKEEITKMTKMVEAYSVEIKAYY